MVLISTTILNQFIKNNIFIDEIIVFRFSCHLNKFDENSNAEVNDYTIPWLKENQPLIKLKFQYMIGFSLFLLIDYFSSLISRKK